MKLVHPLIKNQIVFNENRMNVLVIENGSFMAEIINEINQQIDGKEGRFVLSDSGKEMTIDKNIYIVVDYFNIDCNSRKIISGLYKSMEEIALGEDFYSETAEIRDKLRQYLYKLEDKIKFEIHNDNEFNITAVFKALNVKFEMNELAFAEKLVEYIELLDSIAKIKVFILVNLKSFVSDDDLQEIYKFFKYNKLNVLLVESGETEKKFEDERICVVDKDLCEIMI